MHPEYGRDTPLYDMLSLVLGELEYTAYGVLETIDDWPGFWADCQRGREMMEEGLDEKLPVDWAIILRIREMWDTVNFQQHLLEFYQKQSEVFRQYLGPSLYTHYFAYESHRPGALVLTAWEKECPAPQPRGGLLHV